MKKIVSFILAALILTALLCGCGTKNSSYSSNKSYTYTTKAKKSYTSSNSSSTTTSETKKPTNGMTKSEVRSMWGEPTRTIEKSTSVGYYEDWYYEKYNTFVSFLDGVVNGVSK